ncbi:MAG: pentapeptide repeat-containing protein [Alphaproteobacteria bacterium]|nr:pentapeptide repeat-containing protein [Alphaproteobacteria bacterium]
MVELSGSSDLSIEELARIMQLHRRFVEGRKDGLRADLKHRNFTGMKLRGLNFRGAVLAGCDFGGADVSGCDFSTADLFGANFRKATAVKVNFERADLRGADFRGAVVNGSNFMEADLRPGQLMMAGTGRKDGPTISNRHGNGIVSPVVV